MSGGTDNHLVLVNLKGSKGIDGARVETVCDKVAILLLLTSDCLLSRWWSPWTRTLCPLTPPPWYLEVSGWGHVLSHLGSTIRTVLATPDPFSGDSLRRISQRPWTLWMRLWILQRLYRCCFDCWKITTPNNVWTNFSQKYTFSYYRRSLRSWQTSRQCWLQMNLLVLSVWTWRQGDHELKTSTMWNTKHLRHIFILKLQGEQVCLRLPNAWP